MQPCVYTCSVTRHPGSGTPKIETVKSCYEDAKIDASNDNASCL